MPEKRLQGRLDAALERLLYPDPASKTRFLYPAGEPALVTPDSVSWQIFKNPVSLLIGGVSAVILELAEPRVRSGVWEHTTFRQAPLPRLQRTGLAAMMTVYGPRQRTRAMIHNIVEMHEGIKGRSANGQAYRANDPQLLNWVQATASFGFLEAYRTYVYPLDAQACDRFYAESQEAARLYGATDAPASTLQANALLQQMCEHLEPSPVILEFLALMRQVPLLPKALQPIQAMLIKAAVAIVPPPILRQIGLDVYPALSMPERWLVRRIATTADHWMIRASPAVQACRRLGLPDDYLYR